MIIMAKPGYDAFCAVIGHTRCALEKQTIILCAIFANRQATYLVGT